MLPSIESLTVPPNLKVAPRFLHDPLYFPPFYRPPLPKIMNCLSFFFLYNASSAALELSKFDGVLSARTSQKLRATVFPARRVTYNLGLSYELLSQFGTILFLRLAFGTHLFHKMLTALKYLLRREF